MKNFNLFTLRNFGFLFAFMAAIFLVTNTSCNSKPPQNSRAVQAANGKVHFIKHCSACHGEDGTGLILDTLAIQPANLTMINTSRRTNDFPILEIANIIDGRRMSKHHGTRDMPIWGEVFSKQEHLDEAQIKGKLGEIIAYLMSIQR